MPRPVAILFVLLAIVAGGFWLAWGNPGGTLKRHEEHAAVRAAMERFAEVQQNLPAATEIRSAGTAMLGAAEELQRVDLTGTPDGFRSAWQTFVDARIAEGIYATSVDLSRQPEELDRREAELRATREAAEEDLLQAAGRSGVFVRPRR